MSSQTPKLPTAESTAINRRQFIQKSAIMTGSFAGGTALLSSLGPMAIYAAQVNPDDPELASSEVKFNSTDGTSISGYLTRPKGEVSNPAIVVIHENRGLNDHIRDVARRLAKAGFVALAPDLLSRQGGASSFANSEAAIEALRKITEDHVVQDLTGAINHLKDQRYVRANKIGVTGFCWGGGNALLLATRNKDISAAVVYYGRAPRNLDDVKNIAGPVFGHYGEKDEPINSQLPKLAEAMKQVGKSFEYKIYPNAPHAFNNDTNPERYQPEAAKEAWAKTLEFFKKHLQSDA
jgi:carboxymethylenebutenolidase